MDTEENTGELQNKIHIKQTNYLHRHCCHFYMVSSFGETQVNQLADTEILLFANIWCTIISNCIGYCAKFSRLVKINNFILQATKYRTCGHARTHTDTKIHRISPGKMKIKITSLNTKSTFEMQKQYWYQKHVHNCDLRNDVIYLKESMIQWCPVVVISV